MSVGAFHDFYCLSNVPSLILFIVSSALCDVNVAKNPEIPHNYLRILPNNI